MNKKALVSIALGLMIASFIFCLVSFAGGAAGLAMTILTVVFSAGAIVCLVLSMISKKSSTQA